MGLIRKAASVSTFGAVGFHSRREAQAKAALAQARLATEERKAVKHERKAEDAERRDAESEQREQARRAGPGGASRQSAMRSALQAGSTARTTTE